MNDHCLVHLAADTMRLVLAPAVGGSVAAFFSERDGIRFDWLRPATADTLASRELLRVLGMASFPMLPWCNRLRHGRAHAEGRDIAIAAGHPAAPSGRHPLHGIGWLRPWRLAQAAAATAQLVLEVEADAQWPWRFEASQTFELDAWGLRCTMALTNRDTAPMPAGIGHHPYFPHPPGTRLKTDTAAMWLTDAEVMPHALEPAAQAVALLRQGVQLSELDLDNNFTGWQHHARIEWPAESRVRARALVLAAESPLDFFVLYCPRGAGYFCAEPASQCADALDLRGRLPQSDVGGAVLAPGATLSASWTLAPEW
ncbi:MAG: aldose 1-epimerase [Variovorax sp.]